MDAVADGVGGKLSNVGGKLKDKVSKADADDSPYRTSNLEGDAAFNPEVKTLPALPSHGTQGSHGSHGSQAGRVVWRHRPYSP